MCQPSELYRLTRHKKMSITFSIVHSKVVCYTAALRDDTKDGSDPGLKALYSNNLTQIVQPVTRWLLNKRVSVQKILRSVRSASNPGGGGGDSRT